MRLDSIIRWGLTTLYDSLLVKPMRDLYFNGYVWRNHKPEDVCYEITGVSAQFWKSSKENMKQCEDEMNRSFETWYIIVTRVTFLILLFLMIIMIMSRIVCCCGRNNNKVVQTPVNPEELRRIIAETVVMLNSTVKK